MSDRITIYHNPRCSKSRQTLALIEQNHNNVAVIHYLKTPPDAAQLKHLLQALGLSAREILRTSEEEYKTLALNRPDLCEQTLINAMVNHPKLIERPIVIKGEKAVLGRPPENVLTLL